VSVRLTNTHSIIQKHNQKCMIRQQIKHLFVCWLNCLTRLRVKHSLNVCHFPRTDAGVCHSKSSEENRYRSRASWLRCGRLSTTIPSSTWSRPSQTSFQYTASWAAGSQWHRNDPQRTGLDFRGTVILRDKQSKETSVTIALSNEDLMQGRRPNASDSP